MAVEQRHVQITSPCPVKLDPNRGKDGAKSWYCGHCEKNVQVLSNMTEPEARSLLEEKVGQDLCVSYAVKSDGTIRFKAPAADPTVVPLSRVRRPPRRAATAVAAAAGLTAALAACTPHDRPDKPQPQVAVQEHVVDGGVEEVVIPEAKPTQDRHDDVEMMDGNWGGEAIPQEKPEELPMPAGGMVAVPVPEPDPVPKPGGIRVAPIPDPVPEPGGLVVEPIPDADEKAPCDKPAETADLEYLGGM